MTKDQNILPIVGDKTPFDTIPHHDKNVCQNSVQESLMDISFRNAEEGGNIFGIRSGERFFEQSISSGKKKDEPVPRNKFETIE